MGDIWTLVLIFVVYLVLARIVLPKMGIRG